MGTAVSPESASPPKEVYAGRTARYDAEVRRLEGRSGTISRARLAAFVTVAALLVVGVRARDGAKAWAWAGGAAATLAFAALVLAHDALIRKKWRNTELQRINEESLHRLDRRWRRLRNVPAPPIDGAADVARDLDLLGDASVYRLLATPNTPYGRAALARWLLDPAEPAEVRRRQAVVAELAPDIDFRQELQALGSELGERGGDAEPLVLWAEGKPWLIERPWIVASARLSGLLSVTLAAAHALGWTAVPLWLLPLALNGLMTLLWARRIYPVLEAVSSRAHRFGGYSELLRRVSERSFDSSYPNRLRLQTAEGETSAWRQMRRLERIVGWSELRLSPMFHIGVQAFTMWDFHVVYLLERWQREVGAHVRGWLTALGEIEALGALAVLRFDHPSWSFPELREEGPRGLAARGLGHPLLPPDRCVLNDVELGGPVQFLLVTGSNMSGKSTLLRSLGVNVALAHAGAPVFAESMRLSPMVLGTSFRITDSLEQGVSFFMAELQHLKRIVDRAEQAAASGRWTLLFLLDEVLLGTNIIERRVAVRSVLFRLLELGAIGAISSHDITLAETGELDETGRAVHFTETYADGPNGPRMEFDYKLRSGVATSVNALQLLRLIGLEVRDEVRRAKAPAGAPRSRDGT